MRFGRNDLFKFGVSHNPDRRIRDIDSSSPVPIREIGRFWFKNVYEMEEMIHDNIKSKLIRKEWFKINESDVFIIRDQLKEMSEEGTFLTRI